MDAFNKAMEKQKTRSKAAGNFADVMGSTVDSCFKEMEKFKPDVVFIGFGAPKQEFFMRDNMDRLKKCGVKYAVGSGGTVDFVSGKINRAPKLVSKLGLEGFYRLFKEFNKARFKRLTYSFKFFKYIWMKPKFKKKVK